jgi:hypothetical protein
MGQGSSNISYESLPLKPKSSINNNRVSRPLVFVTYNVWFKRMDFEKRAVAILDILSSSEADFIMLQEVTLEFLALLEKQQVQSILLF